MLHLSCVSTFDRGSHSRISLNICEHLSVASEDVRLGIHSAVDSEDVSRVTDSEDSVIK